MTKGSMARGRIRRVAVPVGMALACLLQQGCYMTVGREGKYFASTRYLWNGHNDFKTAGDLVMLSGAILVPVAGWVTFVPAGAVLSLAERCVVGPAFDTAMLPIDWFDDKLRQIEDASYRDMCYRLEFNLDAALADSTYWGRMAEVKARHLNQWLAGQCDKRNLSSGQVSAIFSVLRRWLQDWRARVEWQTMEKWRGVVWSVYEMAREPESLDMVAKGLVEVKRDAREPVWMVIPDQIKHPTWDAATGDDSLKFTDEQLATLRDADILRETVEKVLRHRQEKREKGKDVPAASATPQPCEDERTNQREGE